MISNTFLFQLLILWLVQGCPSWTNTSLGFPLLSFAEATQFLSSLPLPVPSLVVILTLLCAIRSLRFFSLSKASSFDVVISTTLWCSIALCNCVNSRIVNRSLQLKRLLAFSTSWASIAPLQQIIAVICHSYQPPLYRLAANIPPIIHLQLPNPGMLNTPFIWELAPARGLVCSFTLFFFIYLYLNIMALWINSPSRQYFHHSCRRTVAHLQGGASRHRSSLNNNLDYILPYLKSGHSISPLLIAEASSLTISYSHSICLATGLATQHAVSVKETLIPTHLPFDLLIPFLSTPGLRQLWFASRPNHPSPPGAVLLSRGLSHIPVASLLHYFTVANIESGHVNASQSQATFSSLFPPKPPSIEDKIRIANAFTNSTSPHVLEEDTCHCCGMAVVKTDLCLVNRNAPIFHILKRPLAGVTRKERQSAEQPIEELEGPVLLPNTDNPATVQCCGSCLSALKRNRIPKHSLANGNWIGEVPLCLQELNFAEKLLVARNRHNVCVVNISEGRYKLRCNAVVWSAPIQAVVNHLPPTPNELSEVLAIYFTGSTAPEPEIFKRTPLLVRKSKVKSALEWLILNHQDYYDVQLSHHNLELYSESTPPVSIIHAPKPAGTTVPAESESLHSNPEHDDAGWTGNEPCVFAVSGLSETDFDSLSYDHIKAVRMKHLKEGGSMLAVGRSENPESMYNNPQLFPSMFPWLFPYGKGGFQAHTQFVRMEPSKQCSLRLQYHDRRFQEDEYFIYIAYSHKQIKTASNSSRITAKRSSWQAVVNRILAADAPSLDSIIDLSKKGLHTRPMNEGERNWMDILKDVENVSGGVDGSRASKRLLQGQLRSLMILKGAPLWFITFSPCDWKNPICLYYAGERLDILNHGSFQLSYAECQRRVAANPVACAKFFHKMVTVFLTQVLGINAQHPGLFGPVDSYFGTVEEQGRLTLHLHMLIWILGMPTLTSIREKLVSHVKDFTESLVTYLTDAFTGDYIDASSADLQEQMEEQQSDWIDPTTVLAKPVMVSSQQGTYGTMMKESNDIVYLSNRHSKHNHRCGGNYGRCKARFPRELVSTTHVDEAGHLHMRKQEPDINTYSPILSYLIRSNTDVQCLLSGTAIKAVLIYVTDYVTKNSLKTYSAFECIKSVYSGRSQDYASVDSESTRKLILKMVNALTARQELGGPLIAAYMLGHGDHYTNYRFQNFNWRPFAFRVQSFYAVRSDVISTVETDQSENLGVQEYDETFELTNVDGSIIPVSPYIDWTCRPLAFDKMCLYEYMRTVRKKCTGSSLPAPLDPDDCDRPHEINDAFRSLPSKNFLLHSRHPQYKTHTVYMVTNAAEWALNWFGGSLPRLGTGDDEFYYMTMLMLFVPWREPSDLQSSSKLWHEVFDDTSFCAEHILLMKNMNVLHECLDARDDMSAQYRAGNQKIIPSSLASLFTDASLKNLENMHYENGELMLSDAVGLPDEFAEFASMHGRQYLQQKEQKEQFEDTLRLSNWDNSISFRLPSDLEPLHGHGQDGRGWGKQLQALRKELQKMGNSSWNSDQIPLIKINSASPTRVAVCPFTGAIVTDDAFFKSQLGEPGSDQATQMSTNTLSFVEKVLIDFNLNSAQSDAFCVVANHIISPHDLQQKPLRMYLGGMGGTGKSQVIKALISLFRHLGQANAFQVIAPTGAAACLVDGTTYHSFLGIGKTKSRLQPDSHLRERIRHIRMLFLDEVSMVSCEDLYEISYRLCTLTGNYMEPFGGISFVFAGDFAQLPPAGPGSRALYSPLPLQAKSLRDQKNALGKGLWHQVTDVVLLKQNMRQQSTEDNAFRDMLQNLRYKNCSWADIELIESRCKTLPALDGGLDSTISTIVGVNHLRDACNLRGSQLFASSSHQSLTTFHSTDRLSTTSLPEVLQQIIWDVPPARSEQVAGKLSLCLGLPVILKENQATELCVTNGAEGFVRGWQSHVHKGRLILDVVFVQLKAPPRPQMVPGLPENVVPVVPSTSQINVKLQSDETVSVRRTQIPILPNFAMTVHSSQGRTRRINFVDLSSCRDHKSYYTALSRSSSLSGTYIVRGFNRSVVSGRANGYFRQELRELEILADITGKKLRGVLPLDITGSTRNELLRAYRSKYGTYSLPPTLDSSLKWLDDEDRSFSNGSNVGVADPWSTGECDEVAYLRGKRKKSARASINTITVAGKMGNGRSTVGSQPITTENSALKRKRDIDEFSYSRNKRRAVSLVLANRHDCLEEPDRSVAGCQWDSSNFSCAYDCFFTLTYHLSQWYPSMANNAGILQELHQRFGVEDGNDGRFLNRIRDSEREKLYNYNPQLFNYGPVYAAVYELFAYYYGFPSGFAIQRRFCVCGWELRREIKLPVMSFMEDYIPIRHASILHHLQARLNVHPSSTTCPTCHINVQKQWVLLNAPQYIAFENKVDDSLLSGIEATFTVNQVPSENTGYTYRLAAAVYGNHHHFTARLWSLSGVVYSYDGQRNNGRAIVDVECRTPSDWVWLNGSEVAVCVYVRVPL